jgi:hypothetical protein
MTQQRQAGGAQHGRIRILGVRSGAGGRDPGAVGAVDGLRAAGLAERLPAGSKPAGARSSSRPVRTHRIRAPR